MAGYIIIKYSLEKSALHVYIPGKRRLFMFLKKHKDSISTSTLLGPAGIKSDKPQCRNRKSRGRDLCYKQQGSQQQNHPNPNQSVSNSLLQQLQHSRTTILCHSGLLLQRNIFYPPYGILPLGIFPYSKRYFMDRVKAVL